MKHKICQNVLISMLLLFPFISQAYTVEIKTQCIRALDVKKYRDEVHSAQTNLNCKNVSTPKGSCENNSSSTECVCRKLKKVDECLGKDPRMLVLLIGEETEEEPCKIHNISDAANACSHEIHDVKEACSSFAECSSKIKKWSDFPRFKL